MRRAAPLVAQVRGPLTEPAVGAGGSTTMSLPEKRTDSDMSPVVDDRDAGRQMVGYTTKLLVQALFPYRKPSTAPRGSPSPVPTASRTGSTRG
jgi:hypothetical protein